MIGADLDFRGRQPPGDAVGCHYVLSGLRLPSQLQSVTAVGRYRSILILRTTGNSHWTTCVNSSYDGHLGL